MGLQCKRNNNTMEIKKKNNGIKRTDREKENWQILFDQIVKGNVIPVIGPEIVELGGKTSTQTIINAFADACGIEEDEVNSFSQLVFDSRFKHEFEGEEIHSLINENIDNIVESYASKDDNVLLRKFLSIPYFPFVITTVFDPTVENIMREIYGNDLQVKCFRNDPDKNVDIDIDINNGDATKTPTIYYMFGKADSKSDSFVVTDTDILKFSRTWMLPKSIDSKAKPSKLSSVLSNNYLLVVGNNYQDWLFRFIWYALKDDGFGAEKARKSANKEIIMPGGMYTHPAKDTKLIEFLNHVNTFTQPGLELTDFVNRIIEGVKAAEEEKRAKEARNKYDIGDTVPKMGTDVFISYSRGDKYIVQDLHRILVDKGLHVWYDMNSLHKGQDFMNQIRNAIKNSTFFVPILTDTIIKQAHEEHPYRLEWKYAVEHINLIGGNPYCFPFFAEGFNMDDIVAAVPDDLKRHDAFSFNQDNIKEKAEELADYLLAEIERRENGKR